MMCAYHFKRIINPQARALGLSVPNGTKIGHPVNQNDPDALLISRINCYLLANRMHFRVCLVFYDTKYTFEQIRPGMRVLFF